MRVTEMSVLLSVCWSSILVILIFMLRRKGLVNQLYGVTGLTLLYIFSGVRALFPVDFISSRGVMIGKESSYLFKKVFFEQYSVGPYRLTGIQIFGLIWLLGFLYKIIRFIIYYQKLLCWFHIFSQPWTDREKDEILDRVFDTLGTRLPVTIHRCPLLHTPVGIGIFRQRIIIPDFRYSSDELYYMLLHECTHFMNHDLLVKWMIEIYISLFWWNPVVYLLRRDLNQTLEIKCDLKVVKYLESQCVIEYLEIILKLLRQADQEEKRNCHAVITMAGSGGDLMVERFKIIAQNTGQEERKGKIILLALGYAAIFALSYSFIFQPYYTPEKDQIKENEMINYFDAEDSYLYLTGEGEYLLITDAEKVDVPEDIAEDLIKNGFEVRREE